MASWMQDSGGAVATSTGFTATISGTVYTWTFAAPTTVSTYFPNT
jgi:hypothetical protein